MQEIDTSRYLDEISSTNQYSSLDRYNTIHSTFDTFKSEEPVRQSLPNTNNKYTRRSAKSRNKNRETKPRPKPLQFENQKYYDQIFPVPYLNQETKDTDASTYYLPNNLNPAEL